MWTPESEEDGPIRDDRQGNENERAEARAASLSLHTPTHHRFVPESLPGDLTRSPAAWPLMFFLRCTSMNFTSSNQFAVLSARNFGKSETEVFFMWPVWFEKIFRELEDWSIYRRADNSPLEGQGLNEALVNVGALDRALRRICTVAEHIVSILNTPYLFAGSRSESLLREIYWILLRKNFWKFIWKNL